ncbi:MAG: 4-hydroxy-tetrahydrodipicolinate reductase [Ferrovibrionaceae bacterium]
MSTVKIGLAGAAGRMGMALVRQIAATPGAALAGGFDRPGIPPIGRDLGDLAGIGPAGVALADDGLELFAGADVVVDFSTPAALHGNAELAAQNHVPYIVGTTGLGTEEFAALKRAARHTAVVQSYTMSLGVVLLAATVRKLAAQLDEDFDIEIVEMHHRMKVDAPSGTAILLGEAAAAGRGVALADVKDSGRDGLTGQRRRGAIGFAALRGGNVVGEHTVIFAADNERLELTHKSADRTIFARGAVRAALWAKGRPPGLYTMNDVLGLDDA